ncbi:MAG: DUF1848 family protein [Candidatus Hodarchaeales archaeon]
MSKKYVISASRRTDILAFPNYIDWFIDKLERGGCYVRNPINGVPFYISLLPEDVHGFVFWTKNLGPVLPRLDEIDEFGKPAFFFLTITGYGAQWEPNAPETDSMLEMARTCMERYGSSHVWWRYDPVIFTQKLDKAWHIENFEHIARAMQGIPRCVMSLLLTEGSYRHVAKRLMPALKATGDKLATWSLARKAELLAHLGEIALSYNIRPEICAQPDIADATKLRKASCMDLDLLKQAIQGLPNLPLKPTRKNCNCHESKDVGNFNTCDNNCLYCSANKKLNKDDSIVTKIDPKSVWLWPNPIEMPIPRKY